VSYTKTRATRKSIDLTWLLYDVGSGKAQNEQITFGEPDYERYARISREIENIPMIPAQYEAAKRAAANVCNI